MVFLKILPADASKHLTFHEQVPLNIIFQNPIVMFFYEQINGTRLLSSFGNLTLLIRINKCIDIYRIRYKICLPFSIVTEGCFIF